MSCIKCDEAQLLDENELELVQYTFVRVGVANILISGCEEHLRDLLNKLRSAKTQHQSKSEDKTE